MEIILNYLGNHMDLLKTSRGVRVRVMPREKDLTSLCWLCENKKGPQAEECEQPRSGKGQRTDSILDLPEERQFANTLILAH